MDFTSLLSQAYSDAGIKTKVMNTQIVCIEPIIPLSKEQQNQLLEGDGQKNRNEYKQINSSTGLAVNYYKILEDTGNTEKLRFEEKVEKPLKIKGGRKANLDVYIFAKNYKSYNFGRQVTGYTTHLYHYLEHHKILS